MPFLTAYEIVTVLVYRTIVEGEETAATTALLKEQLEHLQEDKAWLDTEKQKLAGASNYLHRQVEELLA